MEDKDVDFSEERMGPVRIAPTPAKRSFNLLAGVAARNDPMSDQPPMERNPFDVHALLGGQATEHQLRVGRLMLLSPHMPRFTPAEQEHIYLLYQLMKLRLDDQHGVSDAAADLRELRARHPELL